MNITTPTNAEFAGTVCDPGEMVGISIIRAGDSMLDTFMAIAPEATVGKILIQRNEETREPILFYSKVPPLAGKQVMLLDPMVATGGSAICAIEVLIDKGAVESNITFVNVLACPEGIAALTKAYPAMRIVTGQIDDGLNDKAYIMPGLGDFGDRFFGTV
jgi:uracil phosphoribosyltransferase